MLKKVFSDLEFFREVDFEPGMNVILADQSEEASDTESTNGLGKTTIIRIIQFCLGSNVAKDKVLSHPDLEGVIFGIVVSYEGTDVIVKRQVTTGEECLLVSKSFVEDNEVEHTDYDADFASLSLAQWHTTLTSQLLGRRNGAAGVPTFRQLAYYYMRVGKPAFVDPKVVFKGQSGKATRISVAYLLGLNWQLQGKLDARRSRNDELNKAIKIIRNVDDSEIDSLGDLEADRVVLEEELANKRLEAEGFVVRQDYADLERKLIHLDQQLHRLLNQNHSDARLLDNYRESVTETPEVDEKKPIKILRDAGAVFKKEALESLEKVASFHAQVYRNRISFLRAEIERLEVALTERNRQIDLLSTTKTELLSILSSSGALDALVQLQRSIAEMTGRLEGIRSKIEERKRYDSQKDALSAEIASIRTLLKSDLEDRRETVDEAVALFARYTKHLYGTPAKLGIDVKTAGYSFNITIDRSGSDGVEQMVVFCFDLVIATLRARRNSPFKTLIHDSALFADVDPRQYGLALQLAYSEAAKEGFQYICCLNSGALPQDYLGEIPFEALIRLRLTDDDERSRLLGMKLSPQEYS